MRGAQRAPELALRSSEFRSPENLIFPALQLYMEMMRFQSWYFQLKNTTPVFSKKGFRQKLFQS